MTTQDVLNPVAFSDAIEMFGPQDVRKLSLQVLNEFQSCVDTMQQSPAQSPERMADRVHKLLGPCGVFGATKLYDLICKLETDLRTDVPAQGSMLEKARQVAITTEQQIIKLTVGQGEA